VTSWSSKPTFSCHAVLPLMQTRSKPSHPVDHETVYSKVIWYDIGKHIHPSGTRSPRANGTTTCNFWL